MRSIQPTEARKRFFTLGNLAQQEPLLVTASVPFLILPVESMLGIPGKFPGYALCLPTPSSCPAPSRGPWDRKRA